MTSKAIFGSVDLVRTLEASEIGTSVDINFFVRNNTKSFMDFTKLSAPSVSLQTISSREGVLICQREERHYRGTQIDRINGPMLTV